MDLQELQRQLQQVTAEMPVDELPALLGVLEASKAAAWARLTVPTAPVPALAGLVGAGEMAGILGATENWVRDKGRAGHIPSVRLGHYVRFNPPEVLEAVRHLPVQHNRTSRGIKKSTGNQGDTRCVSTECPTSSGAERAKPA
jgi:hypothetical protein